MAKLQLASSAAAEPLAATPGNPSGFSGSGRARAVYPSITCVLVFRACSSSQKMFEAASADKLWWSKIWKTCFLARGQRAH